MKRISCAIISLFCLLILSFSAFAADVVMNEDGVLVSTDIKANYAFVSETEDEEGNKAYEVGETGVLYYFDEEGKGSLYSGIYSSKYYESGELYSGNAFYLIKDGYVYSVKETGKAGKYIKDKNTAGTYQMIIDKICYTVDNQTAKASKFTGVYSSKYYKSGALYSGSEFYIVQSGYVNKVSTKGAVSKYVKDKNTAGTYQMIIDKVCYTVDNQTAKASKYTGVYSSKYYKKGVLYSGDVFYILQSGYVYKVSTKGAVSKYIKDKNTAGTYQMIIDKVCYSVDNKTAKASKYTGVYSGKYYKKGALYSGDAFYLLQGNYVYKVSTKGAVAKYIKNKDKAGKHYMVIDKLCYAVDNKTAKASVYTGWYTASSKKYYYKSGKALTGWQTISKKEYHFASNGVLDTNCIVGKYYVDKSGVKATDKATTTAVLFVNNHSSSKDSNATRLKDCYKYIYRNFKYKTVYGVPGRSDFPSRAVSAFGSYSTNCYGYASAFAYCARVLGYDSGMEIGQCYRDGAWHNHGWTLVKVNGVWYVCDPVKQAYPHKSSQNFYMISKDKAPIKYKSGSKYYLTYDNGKATW